MMFVLTNESRHHGTAALVCPEVMNKVHELMPEGFYILPSSIHETIAVSVELGEPEELAQMVSEINMDQVALHERLSNQVYHYDKDLRVLTMATDTPNKRLDGMVDMTEMAKVAEPSLIYVAKLTGR